ncbi:hypothetical protein C8Q78DRAFT_1077574 [Trametes maxima]|nr:hypothetical protein C8Q78DRAFT_1077574 [Trametes maxima]
MQVVIPISRPILRSAREWSEVFAAADQKPSVLCHPIAPMSSFMVKPGDYVAILPDGSGRDDAINYQLEMYARIAGVAKHPHWGNLVKLHWFFSHGELREDVIENALGREYLETVGEKELISFHHDTYMFADRLHSTISAVTFDDSKVSLPIVDKDTWLVRDNKGFSRSFSFEDPKRESYIAHINNDRICHPFCEGVYKLPTRNSAPVILRWCLSCKKWYHQEHCQVSNAIEPTLLKPDANRPTQPETMEEAQEMYDTKKVKFTPADWELWQRLSILPIQRGHTGVTYLLSFELLVSKIRSQDHQFGCPPDVQDFLLQSIVTANHLKANPHEFLAMFNAWRPQDLYECPVCQKDI